MSNQANQKNQPQKSHQSKQTKQKQQRVELEIEKEEELILDRSAQKEPAEKTQTPQEAGEQSISGHMPDPEKDDDVLEAAKRTGLYTEATEQEPVKVGIAQQVEKAEKERRSKKRE